MLILISYLMCACIFLYIHMWLAVLYSVAVGVSLSLHECQVQQVDKKGRHLESLL